MSGVDDIVAAQLDGATVRAAPLVHFAFKSGAIRLWPGFGPLVAGGETWQGLGNLGSLSGISGGPGGAVDEINFSLTATEEMLGDFQADADEAAGRDVFVWLQFFDLRQKDADGNWVDWKTLGSPRQLFWGRMGPLTAEMSPPSDGGERRMWLLSLTAQNAFLNRARPTFSYFSDRDQKSRDPTGTDNIFLNVPKYVDATARWPTF